MEKHPFSLKPTKKMVFLRGPQGTNGSAPRPFSGALNGGSQPGSFSGTSQPCKGRRAETSLRTENRAPGSRWGGGGPGASPSLASPVDFALGPSWHTGMQRLVEASRGHPVTTEPQGAGPGRQGDGRKLAPGFWGKGT